MRRIAVSYSNGDVVNQHSVFLNQSDGRFNAHAAQVFAKGQPQFLTEERAEIIGVQMYHLRHIAKLHGVGIVSLYV